MNTTRVSRLQLIEIVEQNRAKHMADFAKAIVGWREDMIATVKRGLKDLNAGIDAFPMLPPKPHHYIKQYELALRKLELSVDDIIELDDREFDQLVNDNWQEKLLFAASAAKYLG